MYPTNELARLLGLDPSTVRGLVASDPAYRPSAVGDSTRPHLFSYSQLLAWRLSRALRRGGHHKEACAALWRSVWSTPTRALEQALGEGRVFALVVNGKAAPHLLTWAALAAQCHLQLAAHAAAYSVLAVDVGIFHDELRQELAAKTQGAPA